VLGRGTSQTSIASACVDMYLTPRLSGRKPEMGMNARAISLSRQIPSTLTFFVVAVLHGMSMLATEGASHAHTLTRGGDCA
jgi:hypothetical protein